MSLRSKAYKQHNVPPDTDSVTVLKKRKINAERKEEDVREHVSV
jgi:hypothetical protein